MPTFKAEVSWKKKQASGWGTWPHNQGKDGGSASVKLHNVLSTEVTLVYFLVRLEDQKWLCPHGEAPRFSEAFVQQIILSLLLASVTGKVIVSHCSHFSQGVVGPGTTFCGNSSLTYSFHGHFVNGRKRNARKILSFSHLTLDCFWGLVKCAAAVEKQHTALFMVQQSQARYSGDGSQCLLLRLIDSLWSSWKTPYPLRLLHGHQ